MRLAISSLLVFMSAWISAQIQSAPSHRHYTTRDGLPSTQIQGLYEDSKGYIWSITDRGASVFDGYKFKTYTTKNGLPANSVLLINEDHQGRIWFMCNNGKYCFLQGDTILEYAGNAKISKLLRDKLPGPFYFDDKDTMWVTTFSGIQLFKCFNDSVQEFIPQTHVQQIRPMYYLQEVGDKLVNLQIGEVSDENKLVVSGELSYLLSVAGECKLACSVKVGDNKWVLSGPGGYVVFDEQGKIQTYFNSSPYVFSSMDHDRSGNLWLTNSNGAYQLKDYNDNPDSAQVFFEGHFITAVLQDKSGNYWFGDRDNGIYFVPFLELNLFQSAQTGKSSKIVSVKEIDHEIFYSDASGEVFRLDNGRFMPVLQQPVPSGVGLDFEKTEDGDFIVGNKPFLYNPARKKMSSLEVESVIRKSLHLRDGRCVFALADGLAFLDKESRWTQIDKSQFRERCNALYEAEDGTLWIGTNSGLYVMRGDSIEAIGSVNATKPRIVDIAMWMDYLVLATRSGGLIFYRTDQLHVINETTGLWSDMTDCVAAAPDGALWVGLSGGIQILYIDQLESMEIHSVALNTAKGLPSNEINDILFAQDFAWIATNSGLVCIPTGSSFTSQNPTPVLLEDLFIGDKEADLLQNLQLNFDQNNLIFHFSALNYRTGQNTRYRYRLRGMHENWQETTNRSAEYWSLPAGSYAFEVSAQNEDGLWSEPTSLLFSISKHFSETWWFRSGIIALSVAVIALVFFLSYRAKRRKLVNKAKMLELKQQALNANMNPHFIFNSLNSIQHFINSNRNQEANEYLSDFSKLIRMNLETNRFNMVALEDELERLELYLKLEQLRFGERLHYSIELEDGLNQMDMQIPPMLLQPYVENALLHGILPSGRNGVIHVAIKHIQKGYQVSIDDNGIGIHASRQKKQPGHQSLALKMNEERLHILSDQSGGHFSIQIEDKSDRKNDQSGTIVTIQLPD
jgi:ligand-binding sensor domain-containing protein/cbb3-type cytochrome oxidase subunit 3